MHVRIELGTQRLCEELSGRIIGLQAPTSSRDVFTHNKDNIRKSYQVKSYNGCLYKIAKLKRDHNNQQQCRMLNSLYTLIAE